ncbi:ribonuclease P protein component [Fulvivirgaceae bacterium BMA10]|uniref:Ribonuclease P protein component n=1 Tax=Splendidivirga corallicola TaxID=3051826 RepID=A0ABT8KZS6_9BACT|nr:ribonuclease P protein component [Fulvivirgaceae bacterium BMA10]
MNDNARKKAQYTFSKNERLNSKKLIQELFTKGSSFCLYPIKIIYLHQASDAEGSNKVLFTVSKKRFKKAVDRNKIKRRLREAYRLNKYQLLDPDLSGDPLLIAYIYIGRDILSFKEIESKLKDSLLRLKNKMI